LRGDVTVDFELYQGLRSGREGSSFERTFRALGFLFHGWSTFHGKRKQTFEEPEQGCLRAIAFDKLGMLFTQVWREVFRAYEPRVREMLESRSLGDVKNLVLFSSPLDEVIGKHGRGSGLYDAKSPPVYLLEILYNLQIDQGMPYFDIRPPGKAPDRPTHHETIISAGRECEDVQHLSDSFTDREIDILKDFRNSVRHLDGSQIRALGTHRGPEQTADDVRWELRKARVFCDRVIDCLKQETCFLDSSRQMAEYAREAYWKSHGNEEDYKTARDAVLSEVQDGELRTAILTIQRPADDIWSAKPVQDLVPVSRKAWAVSRYVQCGAFFRKNPSQRVRQVSRTGKHFKHQWEECYPDLTACGISVLPQRPPDLFDSPAGHIRQEVLDRVAEVLNEVRLEIPGD